MIRLSELKLGLGALPLDPLQHPIEALRAQAAPLLGVDVSDIAELTVFKRSFDARKADLQAVYIVDVALASPSKASSELEAEALATGQKKAPLHVQTTPSMAWVPPSPLVNSSSNTLGQDRPVVIGFGPCGIFAALVLAQMGLKPIVIERGKTVRERTKDTWGLWRKRVLHPESNVQFGEGGAGTFSDGKLYSQIKDPRFLGRKVMEEFVKAGAPEEILFAAHPHIGTFKLVKVVEHLREQIIALGGEIRFQQRLVGIELEPLDSSGAGRNGAPQRSARTQKVQGLEILDLVSGQTYTLPTQQVVLALGHSSRDTFALLHRLGVYMEAKPFSVGFRIEHPQGLIDRARWGRHAGNPLLGAADYKLVHHAQNGRAVYSFCMCPGGTVVAATSEPERVVTNGMSQYSRNERNANAGIVVGIDPSDYPQPTTDAAAFEWALGEPVSEDQDRTRPHPLSGLVLQRQLESKAYVLGGSNYSAPGQLLGDFVAGRPSTALGSVEPSYQPGVQLGDLSTALPDFAIQAMREALPAFGKKIKGFDLPDAVLTGTETRTSSPLKMSRGDDFQSLNTWGLFPAGEGASYAGGILSAGVDGIKVGEAVARALLDLPQPPDARGRNSSGGY